MYRPEIAIIIPTIKRDELLMKTINSILDVWEENWKIFIIDQNPMEEDSLEKKLFYATACAQAHGYENRQVEVIRVEPNSGLNHCRNVGIRQAFNQDIPYTLISADSILFDESLAYLGLSIQALKQFDLELIGFDLKEYPNKCEGWLTIEPGSHMGVELLVEEKEPDFQLLSEVADPINPIFHQVISDLDIWKCSIMRMFFLASTLALYQCEFDERFKIGGNEDFFHRFKDFGRCGWTNTIYGIHTLLYEESTTDFLDQKQRNLEQARNELKKKYDLGNTNS